MEGPVIITHTWVFPPLFLPLVGLCDTLTGGKAPEAFTIPWMCYGGPTFTFFHWFTTATRFLPTCNTVHIFSNNWVARSTWASISRYLFRRASIGLTYFFAQMAENWSWTILSERIERRNCRSWNVSFTFSPWLVPFCHHLHGP